LFFIDVCEDSIVADDVATPSNPLIMLVEKQEFKETPFHVNVSQWSWEEESFRKVVYI
jgi:hypothetical protein